MLLRGVTCSEVRAEELALGLDPNVQVKEEARRLSEQSNVSDPAQAYQPYPCSTDDAVRIHLQLPIQQSYLEFLELWESIIYEYILCRKVTFVVFVAVW